tara:strand:+ start:1054 stop:1326 length:273 start_codon:yes stop_codon:yes gene_type:complete
MNKIDAKFEQFEIKKKIAQYTYDDLKEEAKEAVAKFEKHKEYCIKKGFAYYNVTHEKRVKTKKELEKLPEDIQNQIFNERAPRKTFTFKK